MNPPGAYRERVPAAALQPFVERIWTRAAAGRAKGTHRVLPDGCIDIVFCVDRAKGSLRWARVVGTMRKPIDVAADAGMEFIGVRFRPGKARAFLDFRACELTDSNAPLSAFWDRAAEELAERCLVTSGMEAQARLLESALLSRLPRRDGEPRVDQAVTTILGTRGTMAVERLARDAGVSRQYLNRCFADWIGTSPKFFSRVVRFRSLLASRRARPGEPWAQAALACGYFDQAHLIADFREFTGSTPGCFGTG